MPSVSTIPIGECSFLLLERSFLLRWLMLATCTAGNQLSQQLHTNPCLAY